jgi:alpha-galactosidase
MKKIIFSFCLTLSVLFVVAQQRPQIIIETKNNALVLSVGGNQRVLQSYLGSKLSSYNELRGGREVYLTGGLDNQLEPAIRIVHADGNPSLELKYISHTQTKTDNVTKTDVVLRDPVYPIDVILHYTSYNNEDIIKVNSEIKNNEKSAVTITNFASALLHFDAAKYWLSHFHGDWAREAQPEENQLTSGIKIIDSKLGSRANFYQTPMFFLSLNDHSTETFGELIAGTLAWTGNFQFLFEIDQRNGLRSFAGMNPYASDYHLQPKETFTTPEFIFTYSNEGRGKASRSFHRWARNYSVLDGNGSRYTLLNNWEATHTNFNEARLVELFGEAQKLGVDLFLLDDGWFGNKFPRNDDKAGLGDWQEDKTKLPSGIGYLVKEAEKKGIKFGIWLEPEMVNPKSELYSQHPDWILRLPNREENYGRNQLVLDLTNPAVQDFAFKVVDDIMTKNPGVAYIKWDCNRAMTNAYSQYLKDKQSHLYIDYTRGLYKVMERIRAKYPKLPIMLCSGGGGRTDYGAMKYFTEFWPSDNTDANERVFIQWGYSNFFPAITMAAHITSMGKQSLKFKTDVAMMGKMGYDIRTNNFTAQEMQFSNEAVKLYKNINDVIWHGDQYRLVSPYEENRAVLMYVNDQKDRAIVFNYTLNVRRLDNFSKVKLQGLDPNKKYRFKEINLFPETKSANTENGKVFTGEYLLNIGVNTIPGRITAFTSGVYELTEEK